jgi:hypothetical protein
VGGRHGGLGGGREDVVDGRVLLEVSNATIPSSD